MAKKNRRKRPPSAPTTIEPRETRTADAVTIGWMLCVLTTLLCELGAAVTAWILAAHPDATSLAALEAVLVFSALVIGSCSLAIGAVTWKIRRESPPLGITIFALVIGAAPLVFLLLRWATRGLL